ncbi:MAG: endo-1,4-beta-xylanase [Promicromonosporaceae bacterium]|nr:endo-1,4-beta-xylanase [Promicromonosporaceae bacterium]
MIHNHSPSGARGSRRRTGRLSGWLRRGAVVVAAALFGTTAIAGGGLPAVAAPVPTDDVVVENRVLKVTQTADWQGPQLPGSAFTGGDTYTLSARVLDGTTHGNARFVSQTDTNNFAWLGNTAISTTEWTEITATFTARSTGIDWVRLVASNPGVFYVDSIVVTDADGDIVFDYDFEDGNVLTGDGGSFAIVENPLEIEWNYVLMITQTADWQGPQFPGSAFTGGDEYRLQARVLDGNTGGYSRFVSQTDTNNWAWLGNTALSRYEWRDIDVTFTARATGLDHVRLVGAPAGVFFADDILITRADGSVVFEHDFQDGVPVTGDGGDTAVIVDPLQRPIIIDPDEPGDQNGGDGEYEDIDMVLLHHITFSPDQYETYGDWFGYSTTHGTSMITSEWGFEPITGGFEYDPYVARIVHTGGSPVGAPDQDGSPYAAQRNAFRLTFPEPLAAGVLYEIVVWYYIPFDEDDPHPYLDEGFGNDRKFRDGVLSYPPGFLINGAAGNAAYTFQAPPGLPQGTWGELRGMMLYPDTEIETVDIRFHGNTWARYPDVWYVDNIRIYYNADVDFVVPEWDMDIPSLAETFEPWFFLGNIYGGTTSATMNISNTREFFAYQFNAITAENHHKPDQIAGPGGRATRPTAEEFNFTNVDPMITWAMANDIAIIGHAFVWHSQSPNWMFRDQDLNPLTRAEARDNMEFYIRTLSEHFAARGTLGAFQAWDVANEVIASGGGTWTGDWQTQMREDSPWWIAYANGMDEAAGEHPSDFVYDAFVFARRYFPYSILYYNDYNEQVPAKTQAIAQMVEQLNERWFNDFENNPEAVAAGEEYTGRLLIEGIGLQSHHHLPLGGWSTNFAQVRESLVRFSEVAREQGVRLSITELDITAGGFGQGAEVFPAPLPEDIAQWQADTFAEVFGYYLEFAEYIERVSIWGLADSQSWRAAGHPLLFDEYFQPKPAFWAVIDTAEETPAPVVDAPVALPADLPEAIVADYYTAQVHAERNNWSPMAWTVVDGELPPGMVLHRFTGVIEGTPTTAGTFTFTLGAGNMAGIGTHEYTIVVHPAEPSFVDVSPANPFLADIEWLVAQGITTGWDLGDGTAEFRPAANTTREAMAAFFYRAAGSPLDFETPETPTFVDVPADSTFYREIEWLAYVGITIGWEVDGDQEFRPGDYITREAMAAFFYRAAGSPPYDDDEVPVFVDVPITNAFFWEIQWLHAVGISTGWTVDGGYEFRPDALITREATAAFFHRAAAADIGW